MIIQLNLLFVDFCPASKCVRLLATRPDRLACLAGRRTLLGPACHARHKRAWWQAWAAQASRAGLHTTIFFKLPSFKLFKYYL